MFFCCMMTVDRLCLIYGLTQVQIFWLLLVINFCPVYNDIHKKCSIEIYAQDFVSQIAECLPRFLDT